MNIEKWIISASCKEMSVHTAAIFWNCHLSKKILSILEKIESILQLCENNTCNLEIIKFILNDETNTEEIPIDINCHLFYYFLNSNIHFTDKAIVFFKSKIENYIKLFFSKINNDHIESVLSILDYTCNDCIILKPKPSLYESIQKISTKQLTEKELQYISSIINTICYKFVRKTEEIMNLTEKTGEYTKEYFLSAYYFILSFEINYLDEQFNIEKTFDIVNSFCDSTECGVTFMDNIIYNLIKILVSEDDLFNINNASLIKTLRENGIPFYTDKCYNFSEKKFEETPCIKELEPYIFFEDFHI